MKLIAVLQLIRFGNCCMAAAAVWVGAYLTAGYQFTSQLAAVMLGTFLICGAGNSVNDIVDIDSDRVNHPKRPLPTGRLTRLEAIWVAIVVHAAALPVMLVTSRYVALVGLTAIGLLLAYNFFAKRWGLIGNMLVAAVASSAFLSGGLAVQPSAVFTLPGPLIATALSFCFHLMRELVKTAEDSRGDAQAGLVTVSHQIGPKSTLLTALGLCLALAALTIVPWIAGWYGTIYLIAVVTLVDLPMLLLLGWAWQSPNDRHIEYARTGLKIGMAVGLAVLLLA